MCRGAYGSWNLCECVPALAEGRQVRSKTITTTRNEVVSIADTAHRILL